jgi:hypothetical protein
LIESFRDDPRTKDVAESFLRVRGENGNRKNPRLSYIQRIKELEKQRPLTDAERMYLESVELLSLFNPYLVSMVASDTGVTQDFLNHHFETLSGKTLANLKDGDYIPLIQVGLGPNGLAAVGEVVRNNPRLAEHMLVVDAGEQPGGPFAIPGGPAWELNSANRRGAGVVLPERPGKDELKSVRAFGSPTTRWYPGERIPGKDVRQGSINTTVDYLPTPDDLSTNRYPTNEELQLVLSLQAAMLLDRMALKTRIIKREDNPDPNDRGDKIVTLEIEGEDGNRRQLRLKTDALFVGSGLGDPTYGFPIEGSKAEKVLDSTKDRKDVFPKLSTTLDAFAAFANRKEKKNSPGRTIVLWGKGNSADTLIEFIGNIFQGDNPLVRDITKIYLITDGDLSARPRYALISDLKPRNGRGNLIEQVRARVSDVDFASDDGDVSERQLVIIDESGEIITDNEGRPILADSAIAATGFRPNPEAVLGEGRNPRSSGESSTVEPLVLPTNPDVPVADVLKDDPNTLLFGTASRPRFDSIAKLAQLPPEAREALLRNGAENAVAIGFRAPDTQAAVNIWLNSRNIDLPEAEKTYDRKRIKMEGNIRTGSEVAIRLRENVAEQSIPNNVNSETALLSPLLSYLVGNSVEVESIKNSKMETPDKGPLKGRSPGFTGNLRFELRYSQESDSLLLSFEGGDVSNISTEMFEELESTCRDSYFQTYAISALNKRRRDPKLELNLSFRSGYVNPGNTFVQER